MNIVSFPVNSTNIFPIVNSTVGGQLLSEWNLRTRESVCTNSKIQYFTGPSYTHSPSDFAVTLQQDSLGNNISHSAIQIAPGRALVNGHYIQSLVPVVIDIAEANYKLVSEGLSPLKGRLAVGLRVMYSTEATMVGSMLAEDTSSTMYQGIQVVILPADGEVGTKLTLPEDSPVDETLVNAHLKLAEFQYYNNSIPSNSIVQYANKSASIEASRIADVENLLSDAYVTKSGLNPKKLYTFAGKGRDPQTGYDTWCDSTDSLVIWDNNPNLVTGTNPGVQQAQFEYNQTTGKTNLILPHKQPDGMTDTSGNPQYYADKYISLPVANLGADTGGVVDRNYNAAIRSIEQKIDNYYRLPQGSMKEYIDNLTTLEQLPPIYEDNNWSVGDYILVGRDEVEYTSDGTSRPPATMYVVLPGQVTGIEYVGATSSSDTVPAGLESGVQLAYVLRTTPFDPTDVATVASSILFINTYIGVVNQDYFKVAYTDDSTGATEYYFYKVTTSGPYTYSIPPVWITGVIPLAQESVIGGFYNVPSTALGGGYVYRDDTGHLRLLDYELLVSGVLAYQLGEDVTIPAGLTAEEIQNMLNEYVNDRVAFPNASQLANSSTPYIINVYIPVTSEEAAQTITIANIDSRFNTAVYVHITGTSDNITFNISNCQKIRVDIQATGSGTYNLYNSCLWYDAAVLETMSTISGLSLWYKQFVASDPDIVVDGMTVQLANRPEVTSTEEYWTVDEPNDNHYSYALRSLTFASDGTALGLSLLVTDDITANIATGTYISVFEFTLPQSLGLPYPPSALNKQLKVTGEFITAYPVSSSTPSGYIIKNTSFTALTQVYGATNTSGEATGQIAFHTIVSEVANVSGVDSTQSIDAWESSKFHIFFGGTAE